MLLEFGKHTFAAGTIECVSEARKASGRPGEVHEVTIRTRSGFDCKALFENKQLAEEARGQAISYLPT